MRRQFLVPIFCMLAGFGGGLGVAAPALVSPFKAPEGASSVAIADNIKIHDRKRNKDFTVRVYSPEGSGHSPVIVFSHGAGGSRASFAPLGRYWASHGFVSIHPSHADALIGSGSANGETPRAGGALGGLLARTIGSPAAGIQRARDLSAVIDGLDQIEEAVPALRGRLDHKRIGVGGHSFGAFTAMLVGGATINFSVSEPNRTFVDPRARALLVVSGQGPGQQGLTERSWRKVYLPMLTVTGSLDRGVGGQGPEWKRQPFDLSRPGDKYLLFLEGANHFSFGGELAGGGLAAGGLGPGVRARLSGGRRVGFGSGQVGEASGTFEPMKAATLAFWSAYLKDDGKAKSFLESDRLALDTQRKAVLTHR